MQGQSGSGTMPKTMPYHLWTHHNSEYEGTLADSSSGGQDGTEANHEASCLQMLRTRKWYFCYSVYEWLPWNRTVPAFSLYCSSKPAKKKEKWHASKKPGS
jgi:hypothetical protein